MPWRLIGFLVLMTILVLFAAFNLTNVSDISFGFFTLHDIPVFFSLYIAFLIGSLFTLASVFSKRRRSQKFTEEDEPPKIKQGKKNGHDTAV